MLAATTSATTANHSQALKLLQISVQGVWGVAAHDAGSGTFAGVHAGPNANAFITAIINILLDAQGNANVSIDAKDGFASVRTGDGDDTITMDVHSAAHISSGKGDDSITIRTYAMSEAARAYYPEGTVEVAAVYNVHSGDGNDTITIDTHGNVRNVYAGDGSDVIAIRSTMEHSTDDENRTYLVRGAVSNIDAGAGDDTILIEAEGMVSGIDGGSGNDTFHVSGSMVTGIYGGEGDDTFDVFGSTVSNLRGGEGDDTIVITADRQVMGVWGGDGNDTIEITAPTISIVNGGKGDDTIILNATAPNAIAHINLTAGDGHDVVHVNTSLAIERFDGMGKRFDMSKAAIERTDEATLKITFDDADDSVTVHLTGDMVGKPIAFDIYESGRLIIRSEDRVAVPDLVEFTRPNNPVPDPSRA